jgi:ATP-binding cassette subfamily F protein 3
MRTELAQIDTRLEKLAREKSEVEATLAAAALPPAEIAEAGRRLNHIAAEVTSLEERWLELSAAIEQFGSA